MPVRSDGQRLHVMQGEVALAIEHCKLRLEACRLEKEALRWVHAVGWHGDMLRLARANKGR